MPDYIHLLVSIPPKQSVSSFMGYFKMFYEAGVDGGIGIVEGYKLDKSVLTSDETVKIVTALTFLIRENLGRRS